jgi:hypothetical protein
MTSKKSLEKVASQSTFPNMVGSIDGLIISVSLTIPGRQSDHEVDIVLHIFHGDSHLTVDEGYSSSSRKKNK